MIFFLHGRNYYVKMIDQLCSVYTLYTLYTQTDLSSVQSIDIFRIVYTVQIKAITEIDCGNLDPVSLSVGNPDRMGCVTNYQRSVA